MNNGKALLEPSQAAKEVLLNELSVTLINSEHSDSIDSSVRNETEEYNELETVSLESPTMEEVAELYSRFLEDEICDDYEIWISWLWELRNTKRIFVSGN